MRNMRTRLAYVAFAVVGLIGLGCSTPKPDRSLFVRDAGPRPDTAGVRITYLGVNGYLFESEGGTLLIDPFFSRPPLSTILWNRRMKPDKARIAAARARLPESVDLILVTHGHYDHLLDVPDLSRLTGARMLASPTCGHLARAAGMPESHIVAVEPGDVHRTGDLTIHVLEARHDRILCCVPLPGRLEAPPAAPRRYRHWKMGVPLAFLIELNGQRIYVDSGGHKDAPPDTNGRTVDLAILGVALSDSRNRVAPVLELLRPRYFLPSHQDNFFKPLEEGFSFGPMTDFGAVRRQLERRRPPGELILLDYFAPWTLDADSP